MPQVSKLKLSPINFGGETLGRRISRIRKERGYTQVELAGKIGVIQSIVSAVERDERRLSAEMAIRFALALGVTMDEFLGPASGRPTNGGKPSRKVLRRLERIETLPAHQQNAVLKSIDMMLKGIAS